MRRTLLAALLGLSLVLTLPIAIGGHAYAQVDDDDSALVIDDDDSALAAVEDVLPPVSDEEATAAVKTLLDYQSGGWGALVAALLTLIIFVVRKTGALNKLPKEALPWVAAGVAMIGDVIAAVVAGTAVPDALLQGLMLGAAAVGFWEMALKHVLKEKKEAHGSQQE
jgi:hypothetical protein